MPDLKFEDKDVEQLMKLKTAAEERIACLHKIIIHEEETIKKLRPILRKFVLINGYMTIHLAWKIMQRKNAAKNVFY